ncbi:ABC transporter permease subunit [Zavarzinia sp. CC-PAN008]|uniref:ABC transporter permease subunit n=1 Tax=Zavarzinia sp. CC-PAN008 TaxID=3243332 RepID=UPI003F74818D
MIRFFLGRLVLVVPTLLGVVLLAFLLIRLVPGDPVEVRSGERGISPERHQQMLEAWGLDQPPWKQFVDYVAKVAQGDLGTSVVSAKPVLREFLTLFPATIELTVAAMILAVLVGLPAGVLAALNRGGPLDHVVMGAALTGYSMPIFWWAMILILVSSIQLGLTPVSGRISLLFFTPPVTGFMLVDTLLAGDLRAFRSALHHLILPAIVLGTVPLGVIARMTRSAMLEVLGEDYVRTARAKGLSPFRVVWVHALRNAAIPVITVIGLQVGVLLSGAILTETIFSWPGIGKWLIESINKRDYPAIQGGLLLVASTVVFVNLCVDLLYGVINPRIRTTR